jgi:starch synthase
MQTVEMLGWNVPSEIESAVAHAGGPEIALLHWAPLLEDYLGSLGLGHESFSEIRGGGVAGTLEALVQAGASATFYSFSSSVTVPVHSRNAETGVDFVVLPAPRPFTFLRRHGLASNLIAPRPPLTGARRAVRSLGNEVAPWVSTPIRVLASVLRQRGTAAVICQEYENVRFDGAVALGHLIGVPVFGAFHGGDYRWTRFEGTLRGRSIRAAAGLIISRPSEVRRVQQLYSLPTERVGQIVNPLDLSLWYREASVPARRALGFDDDERVACWHGRLEREHKGLDLLINAWRLVRASPDGQHCRLLMIGMGTGGAWLRAEIGSGDDLGIVWIDRYVTEPAEVRSMLAAADVYVFSSPAEGMPMAPVEAMACELPVVAVTSQGIREIFDPSTPWPGALVPAGDPRAFADAVLGLMLERDRGRERGRLARRSVEQRFDMRAVGEQMLAFMRERGAAV